MRLNGWQRVWVVATVVWCGYAVLAGLKYVPTEQQKLRFWADSVALRIALAEERAGAQSNADSVRNRHSKLDDRAFIEAAQKSYPKVDLQSTLDLYRSDTAEHMWKQQAKAWGGIALYALVPAAVVYGLGLVVAWVVSGFREQP